MISQKWKRLNTSMIFIHYYIVLWHRQKKQKLNQKINIFCFVFYWCIALFLIDLKRNANWQKIYNFLMLNDDMFAIFFFEIDFLMNDVVA